MTTISYQFPDELHSYIKKIADQHLKAVISAFNDAKPLRRVRDVPPQVFEGENHVIFAIGKNAAAYARAFREQLGNKQVETIVMQAKNYSDIESKFRTGWKYFEVDHPLPSNDTFEKTREVMEMLQQIDQNSVFHAIITGGGSSCFAYPEKGVSYDQYREIVSRAMSAGFNIQSLNYVRTLIDQVKGGKTLQLIHAKKIYTWAISDVVPDDIRIIASGPTVPGIESTRSTEDWIDRIFKNLNVQIPQSEFKKKIDNAFQFKLENPSHYEEMVLTKRSHLLQSFQRKLDKIEFEPMIVDANLEGNVEDVARNMAQVIDRFRTTGKRTLLWSGEPTITVTSEARTRGQGGRISSLCALMADHIAKYPNVLFFGLATDGIDGNSPASGYMITGETSDHLRPLGGSRALIRNGNSGLALSSLGYGVTLGITDINLLDIYFAVVL